MKKKIYFPYHRYYFRKLASDSTKFNNWTKEISIKILVSCYTCSYYMACLTRTGTDHQIYESWVQTWLHLVCTHDLHQHSHIQTPCLLNLVRADKKYLYNKSLFISPSAYKPSQLLAHLPVTGHKKIHLVISPPPRYCSWCLWSRLLLPW